MLPTGTTAQNANHSITSRAVRDLIGSGARTRSSSWYLGGPRFGVVPDAAGMSRYPRICDVDVSAFVFERDVHRGDK